MQAAKVPLNEYEFPTSKLANVQSQLEKLVEKNYYLHQSAKDAYRAYLLSYNSHQLKSIFNVHTLDLKAVGKSFGFTAPPRVSCCWTACPITVRVSRQSMTMYCIILLTCPWLPEITRASTMTKSMVVFR